MKKVKITKKIKNDLKKWLRKKDSKDCPFETHDYKDRCLICASIFPSLVLHNVHHYHYIDCPCVGLSEHYVIRKAREITK